MRDRGMAFSLNLRWTLCRGSAGTWGRWTRAIVALCVGLAGAVVALPVASASTACGEGKACVIENFAFSAADPLLPAMRENVVPQKKKEWERSLGGEAAARPHLQARLAGWPQRPLTDVRNWPASDREFLLQVARDTWRGLDAMRDRENGLPIDNLRLPKDSVAVTDARIGDYTSSTNIGLQLIAIVAAHDLELISRRGAIDKIRQVLHTLGRLETHHGLLFNFYDTTSLERTSNFVSFVDSSWLTAGLIVVRATFPELRKPVTALIERTDWRRGRTAFANPLP